MTRLCLLLLAFAFCSCASFIQWVDRYDRPSANKIDAQNKKAVKKCCHCPPSPSTISCQADKLNQVDNQSAEDVSEE